MIEVFVSHSRQLDYENDLYTPLLADPQLTKLCHFFLPHQGGQEIDTLAHIKKSDLVLAEVSFSATGQGIELGWAHLSGIPIVAVYRFGQHPPSSISRITPHLFDYRSSKELPAKLLQALHTLSLKS